MRTRQLYPISLLVMILCSSVHASPMYNVIDISPLVGGYDQQGSDDRYGLNDHGWAAGAVWTHAAFWKDGATTDIGALGGGWSQAYDINNAGQVVGYAQTADMADFAFVWANGAMTNLGTLPGGNGGPSPYAWSEAHAINNAGDIAGFSATAERLNPFEPHAVLWRDGSIQDLGTLPGTAVSVAEDINDSCQVVGQSDYHAFLWEDGTMTSLGALPDDDYSHAWAINNLGQAVGESMENVGQAGHAVLWDNGAIVDLGWGRAEAINDLGQIVGGTSLWESGVRTDINSLTLNREGVTVWSARAINNAGQILCSGTIDGQWTAFILAPVPEPSPLVALFLGLAGLARWRRR